MRDPSSSTTSFSTRDTLLSYRHQLELQPRTSARTKVANT